MAVADPGFSKGERHATILPNFSEKLRNFGRGRSLQNLRNSIDAKATLELI